jgi:hypothetical protein
VAKDKEDIERLKKEIEKLKYEEDLLRKRDERLKWEEDLLEKEEELKTRRSSIIDESPIEILDEIDKEKTKPVRTEEKNIELESGLMYIIEEDQPEKSVKLFLREKERGRDGLYITRSNPEYIKRSYRLDDDTKITWLTTVKAASNVDSISGLQELSILISNFIDEHDKSVIHLDGLEYLISNNEFQMVLRLIQQVRDRVSTSESVVLVPVNSNALEQRQLTLLKRECRTIS